MSKSMNKEEYVSLLEQAVSNTGGSGMAPTHGGDPTKDVGKGSGRFSKTGPEKGMGYRGVSANGDDILNWEGSSELAGSNHKRLKDVDDLVEAITKGAGTDHDWADGDVSPMSVLEMEQELLEGEEEKDEELETKEDKKEDEKEDEEDEEEELDVDEKMEESYSDVNFTTTESEVISKLIREMNMLEEDTDTSFEDDDTHLEEDGTPDIDMDFDDFE